jgi:hypothetical protein
MQCPCSTTFMLGSSDRKASGRTGCVSMYFWFARGCFLGVSSGQGTNLLTPLFELAVGGRIESVLLGVTDCAAAFCVFSSSKVASQSFPARKKPIYVSEREGSSIFLAPPSSPPLQADLPTDQFYQHSRHSLLHLFPLPV